MIGFLCKYKANNNEEYKKIIKARMNLMVLIFVIGSITIILSLLSKTIWKISINTSMLDIYNGFGTGLVVVSIIMWVKNKSILGNEEKLKQSRLNNNDERILEINNKAWNCIINFIVFSGAYRWLFLSNFSKGTFDYGWCFLFNLFYFL